MLPALSSRLRVALAVLITAAAACVASARALTWERDAVIATAGPDQAEVTADFPFRNTSTRPVTITKLSTSCGCTTAVLAKKAYAPGETGTIHVVFTVGDRFGLQEKFVTVATDAPGEDDPIELSFRIDVHAYIACEPKAVFWRVGDPATEKAITCTAMLPAAIRLLAATPLNPEIETRIEIVEPGRKFRLLLKPRSTTRPLDTSVRLEFNVDGAANRTFDAYAYVVVPGAVGS